MYAQRRADTSCCEDIKARESPMLGYILRALAACASIAAFALLSPSASAQFQVHPPVGGAGIGGDPENPETDRFGSGVAIRSVSRS
jgi:hypothetical protein